MKDYIKELCIKKEIKPVYTDNKLTILSNGSQNGIPTLRIHKIFSNCSMETAQAVVNYYLDIENREKYINQIQNHAKKSLGSSGYKISPLNDNFITALIINDNYGKGNIDLNSILMEHSISSMIQKSYNGNRSMKIADGIIEVQDDNITELDIVVDL